MGSWWRRVQAYRITSLRGGNTRMLLTLLFFIVGSVAGVVHLVWWESLPALATVSLIAMLGWPSALFLNIAVFATVYAVVSRIEHRRDGTLEPIATAANGSWRCGPWPLLTGALGLALLDFITLALAGRPWGITSAFGLWGGMALQHAGVSIGNWPGYSAPAMQKALAGILSDATSIMDIGIITSVLLSAALAGKFRLQSRISMRHCGLGARRFVARLWRSAVCCSAMARGWLTAAIPTRFWRHRLRQPAWLDVDRLRPARQLGRSFPASDLRPSGSEPPTTLLKRG